MKVAITPSIAENYQKPTIVFRKWDQKELVLISIISCGQATTFASELPILQENFIENFNKKKHHSSKQKTTHSPLSLETPLL